MLIIFPTDYFAVEDRPLDPIARKFSKSSKKPTFLRLSLMLSSHLQLFIRGIPTTTLNAFPVYQILMICLVHFIVSVNSSP